MKRYFVYSASVLASTLLFVLILSFCGILGPAGAIAATTTLKVLGWLILYGLMVRIPIALIKANEMRNLNKVRQKFEDDAAQTLERSIAMAKGDTLNIKKPSIDNPVTPMPADPDVE